MTALPFEENIQKTKAAVEALKSIHPEMLVEGEIGDIGTGSEIHETLPDRSTALTAPYEARQFVAATRVDTLASAVGNLHGILKACSAANHASTWTSNESLRSRPLRTSSDAAPRVAH